MHFLVDTLCIFFAFAAGYYKNMALFTITALVYWAYCLFRTRKQRRHSSGSAASGANASGSDTK